MALRKLSNINRAALAKTENGVAKAASARGNISLTGEENVGGNLAWP
jgi:hypothetical protein